MNLKLNQYHEKISMQCPCKCFSLVLLYNNTANLGLLFDREIFNERSKNDLYE